MTMNRDRCGDGVKADECFFARLMVKAELERSNGSAFATAFVSEFGETIDRAAQLVLADHHEMAS